MFNFFFFVEIVGDVVGMGSSRRNLVEVMSDIKVGVLYVYSEIYSYVGGGSDFVRRFDNGDGFVFIVGG